jgi:hypothetical protein
MKSQSLTLFKKCPKLGVEKTFSIKLLSIITRMPQGVSLPPREALVASCNFDKHLDRKGFLLYPQAPFILCNYIICYLDMFDYVEQWKIGSQNKGVRGYEKQMRNTSPWKRIVTRTKPTQVGDCKESRRHSFHGSVYQSLFSSALRVLSHFVGTKWGLLVLWQKRTSDGSLC